MSRHNRRVPVEFYHRFTKDTCAFAERFAMGKVVSVLEGAFHVIYPYKVIASDMYELGGYSDRALASGAMAHLAGLVDTDVNVSRDWWSDANLDIVSWRIGSSLPETDSSLSWKRRRRNDAVEDPRRLNRRCLLGRNERQDSLQAWNRRNLPKNTRLLDHRRLGRSGRGERTQRARMRVQLLHRYGRMQSSRRRKS